MQCHKDLPCPEYNLPSDAARDCISRNLHLPFPTAIERKIDPDGQPHRLQQVLNLPPPTFPVPRTPHKPLLQRYHKSGAEDHGQIGEPKFQRTLRKQAKDAHLHDSPGVL